MADMTLKTEEIEKVKHKLKEWDNLKNPKAPLSESQLSAIAKIEEVAKQLSLPAELPEGEFSSDVKNEKEVEKIETVQQFLTNYSELEDQILEEGKEGYLKYQKQLCDWRDEANEVLIEVEKGFADLQMLLDQYSLVSNSTNSLHSICQQIVSDQIKLSNTFEDIKKRLEYFTCLDTLQQRLCNPTLSVNGDTFISILDKLDECLVYVHNNSKYKESSSYSVKFKYCLSKAINMMKQYISQTLIAAKNQVVPATGQQTEIDKADGSNFALFYGRFQAYAFKIKKLIYNIEQRLDNSSEYSILLSDCHEIYFEQRKELMSESVKNAVIELSRKHSKDHCTLVRSGCAFLVHICIDEYQLFFQFFNKPTLLLVAYLEGLCLNLYDILRPIIIHVNHLETLAELCSILRLEMLEEHVQNSPLPLEAFGKVIWQLMQDVQERLVFRAHLYLQSDILNYKPSHGDLAYPEKLEMMESIALSLQEQQCMKRSESRSSLASVASATSQEVERITSLDPPHYEQPRSRTGNSPADLHGMWYPPVRRTLVTLSRLYRCVERPIFQGLSQEALSICVQSIATAANLISTQKSILDGKLFEMKHLLILREQVAPFQVDFTVKEMSLDFTRVKSAAYSLLQKRNRLFSLGTNNAILEFLLEGTPTIKELTVDSRKEVDKQLKATCEAFIEHATLVLISSLVNFLEKANIFLKMVKEKMHGGPPLSLRHQPFASPETIGAIVQDTQRQIKLKLSQIQRSMQLYLANKETELILYRPIKNNVINKFQALQSLVSENGYSEEDRIIIALPTHEQVLILLSMSSLSAQHMEIVPIMESSTTSTENPSQLTRNLEMRKEDRIQSYQCHVCDRHFSSKNSLKVHLESHDNLKKYHCKDCGALFSTQGSYYGHIRRHSGHPIICHYCGKSFYHKDKFKCHLRTHTGEKPFVCGHCPKKFASRDNLKRHDVLVHKNDNDFSCGICSEKFVFYQNFLDHLKSHKIKKYFKCDICKKTVESKSLLLRHMRVHTGKKPYKCEMCPASFSDSSNKKRHMRTFRQHKKLRAEESKTVFPEDVSSPKSYCVNLDVQNCPQRLYILPKNENLAIRPSLNKTGCDNFSALAKPVKFVQGSRKEIFCICL